MSPSMLPSPGSSGYVAPVPRVLISACLAGQAVRYDGSDKSLGSIREQLERELELISICPEVGAGMSVPRPPIQLVETERGIRAQGRDDPDLDPTQALQQYADESLAHWGSTVCGYILKSRSPSCGLDTTPVMSDDNVELYRGSGLQAEAFRRQLPWLQMIDETALSDQRLCRDFIDRCQILARLRHDTEHQNLERLLGDYRGVLDTMTPESRSQIEEAVTQNDGRRFWQAFGVGLQATAPATIG